MAAGLLLGGCSKHSETVGTSQGSTPSEKSAAPMAQKPQAELAQIFSAATTMLSSVKTSEEFAKIKPFKDVSLSLLPNGLGITATGIDPALLLPDFRRGPAIVEITVDSPAETTLQLFYRLPGMARFDERCSIRVPIKAGRNVIYAQLPASVGALRLDPGELPGNYVLESFQAKSVGTPAEIP